MSPARSPRPRRPPGEAHISAEQPEAGQAPRLPSSDVHPGRAGDRQVQAAQGSPSSLRLSGGSPSLVGHARVAGRAPRHLLRPSNSPPWPGRRRHGILGSRSADRAAPSGVRHWSACRPGRCPQPATASAPHDHPGCCPHPAARGVPDRRGSGGRDLYLRRAAKHGATSDCQSHVGSPAVNGLRRSPSRRSASTRTVLGAVRTYQLVRTGRVSPCRFTPTCSEYAAQALDRHGLRRGLSLTLRRLGRCHPFGPNGFDPVPE